MTKTDILLNAVINSSIFVRHFVDWDEESQRPYVNTINREDKVFDSVDELVATLRDLANVIESSTKSL